MAELERGVVLDDWHLHLHTVIEEPFLVGGSQQLILARDADRGIILVDKIKLGQLLFVITVQALELEPKQIERRSALNAISETDDIT